MTAHGGDVWQVAQEFGIPAKQLLDFSANINPRGLPQRARLRLERDAANSQLLSLYPDPEARCLRQALSAKFEIPSDSIVIGPGAEALLAPILRSSGAKRAVVPVPAFSEYRRVCEQQQITYAPIPREHLRERLQIGRGDVVILNNPHNPTGSMVEASEVLSILDQTRSAAATLLVDEAFIDYAPHASVVKTAAVEPGLVVLRSLTKLYGCPSLRVGYAVAPPETAQQIASLLPTWAVTQLALNALTEAVADREYAEQSLQENELARERLAVSIRALGIAVPPSAANYLLLELSASMPCASELRIRMIEKHHILIRNCDSYEGMEPGRFVRVAVRSAADNQRLLEAFAKEISI